MRAFFNRFSGVLLLLGAGPLSVRGQSAAPPAPPPAPSATAGPLLGGAFTGGHGGAKPEISEPDLGALLLRLRTASPRLAAARARSVAATLRHERSGFGSEPPESDPLFLERQAEVAVSTLFAQIYEIDRELEVHRAGSDLLDLLKESVAWRYVAGQTGQEELVRVQLEALHASGRRIELEARRTARVTELNLQAGLPATTPMGVISRLPAQLPPPLGANFLAGANAPLLLAARQRLRKAEGRSAGAGKLPDDSPRPAGRVAEKVPDDVLEAEIEAARAELRAAESRVQAEVARLQAAWEREDRQLTQTRDGLLPQSGLLFEATRTSYLAGRAPFSAVVEALRLWLEARTESARREAARFVAGAELEALLLPVPPSPPVSPNSEPEP